MYAILQQSADFPANDERLRTARARAVTYVFHRQRMSVRRLRMRRQCDPDGVVLHGPRDRHRTHGLSHFEYFALTVDAIDLRHLDLRDARYEHMHAIDCP